MCLERERTPYEDWLFDWRNGWAIVGAYAGEYMYEIFMENRIDMDLFDYLLSDGHEWAVFYENVKDPILTFPKSARWGQK